MSSRTFVVSALVAVTLVLGLAGCSSDDADPLPTVGATTPPLDKFDFMKQANTVCTDAEKRIADASSKTGVVNNNGGAQVKTEQQQLVEAITPIAQNAIDQLKSLTPPAEDQAKVRKGIDQMQATLDQAKVNPSGTVDPIAQSNAELYAYGLNSCFGP